MMTRLDIDAALTLLELEMPFLKSNTDRFHELLEDRIELLMADVYPHDEAYAVMRVKAVLARSRVHD